MRPVNYEVLTLSGVQGTAESLYISTEHVDAVSAYLMFRRRVSPPFNPAPSGIMHLQGSNDIILPPNILDQRVPIHWANTGIYVVVNGYGDYIIPATDVCYAFVRLFWQLSGGRGTITAILKTVGY